MLWGEAARRRHPSADWCLTERWHLSALMLTDRWSPPMRKPRQSEPRQCKPQQRKADDLSRCLMPLIANSAYRVGSLQEWCQVSSDSR
jgi:hypothetical protein